MSDGGKSFDAVGWRANVEPDAGEIRLEHDATGSVYVLDADGGLRVPGEANAGVDPAAVQAALESAVEAGPPRRAMADGGQSGRCAVECDEATGEVTIESDTKISLDAPVVDIASGSNTSVTSSGVLTLRGALVQVN